MNSIIPINKKTTSPINIELSNDILREIRKEALARGLRPQQIIKVLIKIGLDVYSGRSEVIANVEEDSRNADD